MSNSSFVFHAEIIRYSTWALTHTAAKVKCGCCILFNLHGGGKGVVDGVSMLTNAACLLPCSIVAPPSNPTESDSVSVP